MHVASHQCVLISIFVVLWAHQARAQDNVDDSKERDSDLISIHICCGSKSDLDTATTTSSRIPIPSYELEFSVGVLQSEFVSDENAYRLETAAPYISGVIGSNSSSGFATAVFARGFNTAGRVYVNGHQDNQQFYRRDFVTIDRVELLKGHSSVLFGPSSPGGTLNYISKRPLNTRLHALSVGVGNFDLSRFALDSTGPVSEGSRLLYRLTATTLNAETVYDNVDDDRWVVMPSLLFNYAAGEVRVETEAAQDKRPLEFGIVFARDTVLFDKSYVDPRAEADKRYRRVSGYWDHDLSEDLSIHTSASYFTTKRNDVHIGFASKQDEDTLNGFYRRVNDDYDQHNLRTELRASGDIGATKHKLIVGAEQNRSDDTVKSLRNIGGFSLDIDEPVFDVDIGSLDLTVSDFRIEDRDKSVYALDRIELSDAWHASFGGRYSSFDDSIERLDRVIDLARERDMSYSGGLVFTPQNKRAYYASFSESFEPNWGRDRDDQFFNPIEGRQYELGFRRSIFDDSIDIHGAIYDLTQRNLTTTDPDDPDFQILTGKRRSRGVEFDIEGPLTESFRLRAGYSYIDATFINNNDGDEGNSPSSVPKHSGSIYLTYIPLRLPGFTLGTGVIGIDERFGDNANSFEVPSYARVDLDAQYKRKNLTYGLRIENVFDKQYVSAAFRDDDLFQGNRRMIMGSLSIER